MYNKVTIKCYHEFKRKNGNLKFCTKKCHKYGFHCTLCMHICIDMFRVKFLFSSVQVPVVSALCLVHAGLPPSVLSQ